MHVAVIGAGVIGCSSALSLADRGVSVTILERSVPGAEASSAAAGILGAQVELAELAEIHREDADAARAFVRARQSWAAWAARLREATGIDVGYRVSGVLRVARSVDELSELRREVAWQKELGLRADVLDGSGAREVEPELSTDVLGAAYFADDAQVDPPALLRALMAVLGHTPDVTVRAGATVERLLVEEGRCVGVRLDGGDLRADATVLAAGSWSSLVPGVPAGVPAVRPVRGQIVLLEERPPRLRSIVFGNGGYVVPRGDGRVLCGSTLEYAGFRKEVTAGGVRAILEAAIACAPALASAQLAATWSNFRPEVAQVEPLRESGRGGSGSRPLVGASPLPGLFLATGHYRNGILLSKEAGDAVAQAITG